MNNRYTFHIIGIENKFQFIFHGGEGQILIKSISFKTVEECIDSMMLSKKCGSSEDNYLRMISEDHQYYFMLRDDEGKELANGKKTPSMQARNANLAECIKYIRNGRFMQAV